MRFLALLLFISGNLLSAQDGFRDWTSSDGKKIKGKIVGFEEKEEEGTGKVLQVALMDMKIVAGNEKKGELAEVRRFSVPLARFDPSDREDIMDWDWVQKREPFWERTMSMAMGETRDVQKGRRQEAGVFDRIVFRDTAVANAIVQNQVLQVRTAYGVVSLPMKVVAAIQFGEDGVTLDQLYTVNNNRFSGIVSLPPGSSGGQADRLTYQTDGGSTESLRKEMVAKVVFRVREDEFDGIDAQRPEGGGNVFFRLKNGDYFDAKLSGGQFSINSLGRPIHVPVQEVIRVEAAGNGRPQTTIFKTNGGKETGFFSPDDLGLELDVGPSVPVFRNRLDTIFCKEGFRPFGKIVQVASAKEAKLSIKAGEGPQPYGTLSRVSSSSPFNGVLQQDDKVVTINNQIPDFESKDDTYELAQEAMFEEKSLPYITMGILRGESFFQVTILGSDASPAE